MTHICVSHFFTTIQPVCTCRIVSARGSLFGGGVHCLEAWSWFWPNRPQFVTPMQACTLCMVLCQGDQHLGTKLDAIFDLLWIHCKSNFSSITPCINLGAKLEQWWHRLPKKILKTFDLEIHYLSLGWFTSPYTDTVRWRDCLAIVRGRVAPKVPQCLSHRPIFETKEGKLTSHVSILQN